MAHPHQLSHTNCLTRTNNNGWPLCPVVSVTSHPTQYTAPYTAPHMTIPSFPSNIDDNNEFHPLVLSVLYELIDEVLQDCTSSLGLRWSLLDRTTQPSMVGSTFSSTCSVHTNTVPSNFGLFENGNYCNVTEGSCEKTTTTVRKGVKRKQSTDHMFIPFPADCFSSFPMQPIKGGVEKCRVKRKCVGGGYKVRFSHNHFEEMIFKQDNPTHVFYKFT